MMGDQSWDLRTGGLMEGREQFGRDRNITAPGGIGRAGWNLAEVGLGAVGKAGQGSLWWRGGAGQGQQARPQEVSWALLASAHMCLVPTGPPLPGLLLPAVSCPLSARASVACGVTGRTSQKRGSPDWAPRGTTGALF